MNLMHIHTYKPKTISEFKTGGHGNITLKKMDGWIDGNLFFKKKRQSQVDYYKFKAGKVYRLIPCLHG